MLFLKNNYYTILIVVLLITFNDTAVLAIQTSTPLEQTQPDAANTNQIFTRIEASVQALRGEYATARANLDALIEAANQGLALAHNAAVNANDAQARLLATRNDQNALLLEVGRTLIEAQRIRQEINNFDQIVIEATQQIADEVRAEFTRTQNNLDIEHRIRIAREKIQAKQDLGIFDHQIQARSQAVINATETKWTKIKEILNDSKLIAKIVCALITLALGTYIIKYSLPHVIAQFTQPTVVTETSRTSWFNNGKQAEDHVELSGLIFNPEVQEQLFNLVLRIQSAKTYNDNFPNVLLYGPPGTGKTAFAKALSYHSKIDYAITSGSEFAKITDLSCANDELRKLLNWANNTDNGLIIFIDEAESLFSNRKLRETKKLTQDFINTFLSLVEDCSHKKVMFIFATNHPFKLDDAILNRIGVNIEIKLPGVNERALILAMYLKKLSEENKNAPVHLLPEIMNMLSEYAENLEGFCPRLLKFIAEEMIIAARQTQMKQLTNEIVCTIMDRAKRRIEQMSQWQVERDSWIRTQFMND